MVFYLFCGIENFIDFRFVDTFDVGEFLLSCHDDARDGTESAGFEFGYVCSVDAMLL